VLAVLLIIDLSDNALNSFITSACDCKMMASSYGQNFTLISNTWFTTGHRRFAECPKHSAKALFHSAKANRTRQKSDGDVIFAECLFSGTRQNFAVCWFALGKIKPRGGRSDG